MPERPTVTAELLEYMAYFYANTDRDTLERDGLIAEGKSGETGWKRFSHNFDIFILKLDPEKRAILADLITRFICPHPDDLAVDRFAAAMKAKLAAKRAGGYGGWDDPTLCRVEFLSRKLREHVEKGDPVDVANFAMMLHQRGSAILPPNEVTEAAIAEHYREACAALVDEMLERKSWSDQPWAKCALIIAARAIRRGRHLTAREMLDNMMRPIAEAEEDAEDEYLCTACGESIREGDYVYIENDEGGFVHAECCGPERESYCDMDGNPLKPGDPIPEPFQFKL